MRCPPTCTQRHGRRLARRGAFTLVEAISALAITGMAASVVLLAMESSVQSAADSVNQTIAQGLADQILDEVLGNRYCETGVSPYQYPMGPNAVEQNGTGRERFNDIDDYHRFQARPAEDRFGVALGQGDGAGGLRHAQFRVNNDFFARWRIRIDLSYVAENNLSTPLNGSATSDYRAVEVTIEHVSDSGQVRELAAARRVVAYIAPPE